MAYQLNVLNGDEKKKTFLTDGGSILRILSNNGIMLTSPCGGNGRCGKCKVKIAGEVSGITGPERLLLTKEEIDSSIRLACYCQLLGNADIELDDRSASIRMDGYGPLECNPYSKVMEIHEGDEHLGIAVDLGTTTLVAYLIDLKDATILSKSSMLNPQRAFGSDVISRVKYTMENKDGLSELSMLIRKAISVLIQQCCMQANKRTASVFHVMIAGNTIMLHLLCKENAAGIVVAPYKPVFLENRDYIASDLDIAAHPGCIVSIIGGVAGYVGADIVAGVYNSKLYQREGVNIFLDIGTNGEIVVGGEDRLVSCATAAGPAFEGGNIRFGMGGIEGAISNVVWKDGSLHYKVIGNMPAKGICGSGILDAVAVLLDAGILDKTGRINNAHPLCRQFENSAAVEIAKGIYITQQDIRQVQLAKAAIAAGIEILLKELKAKTEDVQQVFLAGSFGSALNPYSALRLGIFNSLWAGKTVVLGNTAGYGALQALSDYETFKQMNMLRRQIEYIELSESVVFNNLFINKMVFE